VSTDDELLHVDDSCNDTCTLNLMTDSYLLESHKSLSAKCPSDLFSKAGDNISIHFAVEYNVTFLVLLEVVFYSVFRLLTSVSDSLI